MVHHSTSTTYLCVVLGEERLLFHWLQLGEGFVDRMGVVVVVESDEAFRFTVR